MFIGKWEANIILMSSKMRKRLQVDIAAMSTLSVKPYQLVDCIAIGEVGAYPHGEACPYTLLFAHRVTSG